MLVGKRADINTFGNPNVLSYATPPPPSLSSQEYLIPPILLPPRKELPHSQFPSLGRKLIYLLPSAPRGGRGWWDGRRRKVNLASMSFCGTECLLACLSICSIFAYQGAQLDRTLLGQEGGDLSGEVTCSPETLCILVMYVWHWFPVSFRDKNNYLSRCTYILSV